MHIFLEVINQSQFRNLFNKWLGHFCDFLVFRNNKGELEEKVSR